MLSSALKRECDDALLEDALLCTDDASYALNREILAAFYQEYDQNSERVENKKKSHMHECNRDTVRIPFELTFPPHQ